MTKQQHPVHQIDRVGECSAYQKRRYQEGCGCSGLIVRLPACDSVGGAATASGAVWVVVRAAQPPTRRIGTMGEADWVSVQPGCAGRGVGDDRECAETQHAEPRGDDGADCSSRTAGGRPGAACRGAARRRHQRVHRRRGYRGNGHAGRRVGARLHHAGASLLRRIPPLAGAGDRQHPGMGAGRGTGNRGRLRLQVRQQRRAGSACRRFASASRRWSKPRCCPD